MSKLFYKMPCLSESNEIKFDKIRKQLFDKNKNVDPRYLESSLQKFIQLNKKMFSFLGISTEISGTGSNLSIKFKSSKYIGAIPVKMPYDGKVHKDFQIIPRFDNSSNEYSDLTQLLEQLKYSISPEYADEEKLVLPLQLRPPLYYEAAKFIDLFIAACNNNWVKFEIVQKEHSFPKSNTDWAKYAIRSSNPEFTLKYPSSDSILSINHKEWRELIYVFNLAQSIITQTNVPSSLRYKYAAKSSMLKKKIEMIAPLQTKKITIHAVDPMTIKKVKNQANVLLEKGSTSCTAWRIDMALLFERYVQHLVSSAAKGLNATVKTNSKISGNGIIPQWGIKYLEPDLIIKYNDTMYIADAKYKTNYYALSQNSEILKETHRSDLHQLLAYCSFSPERNKMGILFYPSRKNSYRKLEYLERTCGVQNTVFICGISFGIKDLNDSILFIKDLFSKYLD